MDFEKNLNKPINNSTEHYKLKKTLNIQANALCPAPGPTTATDEVNMLTNCKRCHNKGVYYYLGVNNSQKAKLLKAFIILLATICAVYVCMLSSRRYFYTWVQTVIESTDVHVSEVPFPAITICPVKGLNLVRLETEAMAFTTNSSASSLSWSPLSTDKDFQDFNLLLHSLNDLMWPSTLDTMEKPNHHHNDSVKIEEFLEHLAIRGNTHPFDAIDLNELLYFISFECDDIFAECTWRRKKVSCCTLFHKIQTYKGICYAFNSLHAEDPDPTWPWIVSDSGLHTGLKVLIKRGSIGNYYEKVATMVHDPQEIGTTDITYLSGQRVVITVNPLRFTADYDIRTISPDLRHCYFMNELKLLGKNRHNCMRSCRIEYIERHCNCTYLFPVATKSSFAKALPFCKASNLKCIYQHRNSLLSTGNILEEKVDIDEVVFSTYNCKCYPNCNYIQYGTVVNTDNHGTTLSEELIDLQVQYQHDTLFSYRSSLCFNLLDLIVSYGGIAGLFLGLSFVGVIELLHDFLVYWKQRNLKPLDNTLVNKNEDKI